MDNSPQGSTERKPIYFRRKRIGEIDGRTATFFVTERHWYRLANGFSLDAETVHQIENDGVQHLEFFDRKRRRRERIGLATFLSHAWKTKDFGFGKKLVCDCRFYDGHQPTPNQADKAQFQQPLLFPALPNAAATYGHS